MSRVRNLMQPAQSLLNGLKIPNKLLCGPGPTNMHPDVSKALGMPLLGHLHPEYTQIMDDTKEGIKYLFQTEAVWTLAISGSGHCAMEAACCNLLEPGERLLVLTNGTWGERFADLADRYGIKAVQLRKPPGEVFSLEEVEEALEKEKPQVVFVTHGESSSGTVQPLEGLGQLTRNPSLYHSLPVGSLCHKHNALLLVDSVAAAGGVPLLMDQWELDCVYTGSQKTLGCPPGICPIALSERARHKVLNRKTRVPSFYLDLVELTNYWGCDEGPRRYHHTGTISLVYALRESLRLLAEEGLPSAWKRHEEAAAHLHAGLQEMGLELFVKDPKHRLPCVTTIKVPADVDWKVLPTHMMTRHRIEIAGGLGPTAGKVWRIGIMGINANIDTVNRVLEGLREVMTPRAQV